MKVTASQIYLAFVMANVFCKGVGLNNSSAVYRVIMVVGLSGVLAGIATRAYSRREIWFSGTMLLSGIMTLLITKQYTFLITCIAVIGIKKTDINHLINKMCTVRTSCFIAMVVMALLNIIDQDKIVAWRNTGPVSRYGMGYGHPNTLHLTLFLVLTLIYYTKVKSKSDVRKFWIIAFVLNVFVYKYSVSRTGFIVICIFELLILLHDREIFRKISIKVPLFIFCGLLGLTVLTPWLRNLGMLNGVLSFNGRTEYTFFYLMRYGYSLFGFNQSYSETGLILDNGYLRLLIETGICGLLLWVYLNIRLMKRITRHEDTKMAIIVTCFYIYIFMESFSANIFMNYILFLGADEVFNKRRGTINGDDFYADIQSKKITSEIKVQPGQTNRSGF